MNKRRVVMQTGLLVGVLAVLLSSCNVQTQVTNTVQTATNKTLAPTNQTNRNFEVIQALADENLIVGKDTVARVVGGGKVTISVNGVSCTTLFLGGQCSGNTQDETGATVVTLGRPIAGASGKTFTISDGRDSVQRSVITVNAKLNVFFLPVDWTTEMRNNPNYDYNNAIPQMSSASCAFMKAVYPVPPDNVSCNYTIVPYMLRPFEETVADANGQINWTAISAMYAGIGVAGRRYAPDANAVVGVLPPDWFAQHMNSANTLGLELQNVKGIVTSQITPHFLNYQVAAHEIGHTFGLLDDYNFGINPPRNGWIIDSDGFWLNKPSAVQTPHYYAIDDTSSQLGGYISFMGAAGAPIWVDKCTYEYLSDAISSGQQPTKYDCANSPGPNTQPANAQ